jgi:hypothetical protein
MTILSRWANSWVNEPASEDFGTVFLRSLDSIRSISVVNSEVSGTTSEVICTTLLRSSGSIRSILLVSICILQLRWNCITPKDSGLVRKCRFVFKWPLISLRRCDLLTMRISWSSFYHYLGDVLVFRTIDASWAHVAGTFLLRCGGCRGSHTSPAIVEDSDL